MKEITTKIKISVSWNQVQITKTARRDRINYIIIYLLFLPIPVAARSKAWVCGPSLFGIAGSNHASVNVVCCQVDFSATAWSLVQRSPTEYGVSECDREVSIMRSRWVYQGCAMGKNILQFIT
jgi:hypothetical protein